MTGIPITNVNNNCSTGSTALYNANNMVKSGLVDCALALGFERMARGSLGTNFPDRASPIEIFGNAAVALEGNLSSGNNFGPNAPRMFANGVQEYFDKHGGSIEHLAQIGMIFRKFPGVENSFSISASKNHRHSVKNPYSQFRDGWTVEQVLESPKICNQLTKFMCSPTSVSTRNLISNNKRLIFHYRI